MRQVRDGIFDPPPDGTAMITFGALARALPALRRFLARSPGAMATWSGRLGVDLAGDANLPRLLLAAALRRNTAGPVLFSTTRTERVRVAADAAGRPPLPAAEAAAIGELAAAAMLADPDLAGTS